MDVVNYGGYQILQKLGVGGMGVTYLAVQESIEGFKKKIALKKLHPFLADDPALVRSLVVEAKLSVLLHHPNIVSIFDLGREADEYFITMEFVEGYNLSSLLNHKRKLPLSILLFSLMQVLLALDYAHSLHDEDGQPLGLIHRDISPDNILVDRHGITKLADFGLAKTRDEFQKTMPGTFKGKVGYMSPEQSLGLPLTPLTDLFSLGIILYEGLTGVRLFQEDNVLLTLQRVQENRIPPIRQLLPDIDPQLEAIVSRALERETSARYQSAREFYEALAAFVIPASMEEMRRYTSRYLNAIEHEEMLAAIWSEDSLSLELSRKPLVYVLAQDSVFSPTLCEALEAATLGQMFFRFEILRTKAQVDAAMEALHSSQKTPHAVLFGGLSVAMQHPFLTVLRHRAEICTMLLMDHTNGEVLKMAIELCGLDLFLEAPFSVDLLCQTLEQHTKLRRSQIHQHIFALQRRLDNIEHREHELQSQIAALAQANIRAILNMQQQQNKT